MNQRNQRVQVFKMLDEKDLYIEMDICTSSKNTGCLTKFIKTHGIEGFKEIFFTQNGNRYVTDGGDVDEYFDIEHSELTDKEIEIVICKNGDIQIHKVPAKVDIWTGYLTFEVYKNMVNTDKYYVKSIKL